MSRPYSDADVFKAIADPTRRQLLQRLGEGDKAVSELAEPFAMSLPALSKHLQVLREVGLVTQERSGRRRIYHLNAEPLKEVGEWVAHFEAFWDEKLDALALYLDKQDEDA